ncbi:MAG: glutamate-5-semialdehyde dehydrogenase [Bacteroidetes bacterium GWF2_40_14]|nr:MAG: glutamate-5-semialdehyde dehydrogenase [Bacteroidetes bacterium GWF2_40_14]
MNSENKNRVLKTLAGLLKKNAQNIIDHNTKDLLSLEKMDIALIERLKVDPRKIGSMIDSITSISDEKDPENENIYTFTHSNGMEVVNKRVPFGCVLLIYESRPDVTIEAAAVAFKAGNKVLLKGGKEARHTNLYLVDLWNIALTICNQDPEIIRYLDYNRQQTQKLISGEEMKIDLIIPRGGEELINYVKNNSSIPIIASGRGNNFLYIHSQCDFDLAIDVIVDGKRRIGVCNALDKVLIDKNLPNLQTCIDKLKDILKKEHIEVIDRTDIDISLAEPDDITIAEILKEEFLSKKIFIAIISDLENAVSVINSYSGGHSATIITTDNDAANEFLLQTDCAAVYHNASTRFTDGGEFGLGAEIAISTQKLHSRGPLGINQLVTNKWFIYGNGQVRN